MNFLLVFIGGGIGSIMRYIVTSIVKSFTNISFPFGTLTVNIVGSFIMGIITALIATKMTINNESMRLLLAVGFLGGFTTFSSFSMETLILIEQREVIYALLNIIANITFGLIFAWIGVTLIKHLLIN